MQLLFFLEPLYVIIEFVPGGSLDYLLRSSRVHYQRDDPSYTNIWSRLTERELLTIASDIASGMRHLESKQVLCLKLSTLKVLKKPTHLPLSLNKNTCSPRVLCKGMKALHSLLAVEISSVLFKRKRKTIFFPLWSIRLSNCVTAFSCQICTSF